MRERISKPLHSNGFRNIGCVALMLCCLPTGMQMVRVYVRFYITLLRFPPQSSHQRFRRFAGYVRPCGRSFATSGHLNGVISSVDVKLGDSAVYRPICLSGDFQRSQESIPVSRSVVGVDNRWLCVYPSLVSKEFASGGGDVCVSISLDLQGH